MLKWLHKFFYSDDEIVKLVDDLSELESEQCADALRGDGIIAMRKDMSALAAYRRVWPIVQPDSYALFVKHSQVDRAVSVLRPLLGHGKVGRQSRREARRFRRWLKP